jgi:MFS family permease
MATTHPDPRRWYALALLCTAQFMVILDAQIVILALPSIGRALGLPAGLAQWVLSAYLLSLGGLLLLGGRTADLLGRRRVFMAGTALFLVSSLACGLAGSAWVLVAARVVQGMSAAIMAPTALSILMTTFAEGRERNRALGFWSAMGGLGATAALLLGGTLTEGLGWEWIFFLNVPVAALLFGLSPVLLRESRGAARPRSYDPVGAISITAALVLLVDAIVGAPGAGWASPQTVGQLAAALVLGAVFVAVESRSVAPLVPLGLFRSRLLVGGNLAMLLYGMLAWGVSLVVAEYAQLVLGFSPLQFGVASIALTVMAVVGAYAAQFSVTRIGCRPVGAAGMVLLGVASLLLTRVPVHGSYFWDLFPALLLAGAGIGGGSVGASVAALSGVEERDAGLASATNTAALQIGGAFGAAIVTTMAVSGTVGADRLAALTHGFQGGFAACVAFAVAGLLVCWLLLGRRSPQPA